MRVLLISNVFPPKTTTRAVQAFRVASGLSEMGLEVHVLTQGPDPPGAGAAFEWHALPTPTAPAGGQRRGETLLRHALTAATNLRSRRQWVQAVHRACRTRLAHLAFQGVLSFSNPFENHQAARAALPLLGRPRWLAYWSDPWPSTLQCGPYRRPSVLARVLYERQARDTLRDADANLFPTHTLLRHFETGLGVELGARSHVLPHIGMDPGPDYGEEIARGWITHLGTLDRQRARPELVLAVLRTAETLGPERFRGLRLIGRVGPEIRGLVDELGAHSVVRIEPQVPPEETGPLVRSSHALLVVEAPMERSVYSPSKFADYATSRRPILSISPPVAALREAVEGLGGSDRVLFCEYREDAIYDRLCTIFGERRPPDGRSDRPPGHAALADHYSKTRVCNDLKRFMESVVDRP